VSAKNSVLAAITAAIAALAAAFPGAAADSTFVLKPARVWTDGEPLHAGWVVVIEGNHIRAAGPEKSVKVPAAAQVVELPDTTLLPGLMDAHSHLFLHPYNETSWNDQVLKEPVAYRTLRAGVQAKATLMAGFTTLRDLGTEGADYSDVALKHAIDDGLIPGPRLFVATRAIVATGAYGPAPRSLRPDVCCTP
jgi:imidazolonepropionase-like amidohydrolase